ncbi:MAG: glycosyltransferase [Rhodocyclaceae bacterium]|nr:glycosyltransferase [Rhodocyclaceae bacterium]
MPRHHVLGRLARHFEVVWIEPAAGWRNYWLSNKARDAAIQMRSPEEFGIDIYDPGRWLPEVYRPEALGDWIRKQRVKLACAKLRQRGCDKIVLYLWRPEFDWARDAIDADLSCYHIDDEYRFSMEDLPNDPREVALIQRVDQVIIHSRKLLEKKGGINPHTMHVPNGVEYAAHATPAPAPEDIAAIPQPRMGYVGVIKSQLDIGLLHQLAKRRPDWSFVLVGPKGYLGPKASLLDQLEGLPNVYLTGNRQLAELPAYMQAMDVCMMCYEVCDYTNFIYPLKLNEYLATGRPVVTAAIDSVAGLEPLVSIAHSAEEWETALDNALSSGANSPAAIQARQNQAELHDWDRLVQQIADQFRNRLAR